MKHVIDAQGKKVGRLASEIANILMGKNTTAYAKNIVPEVTVEVSNASKVSFDSKKIEGKVWRKYSGFPGGLKDELAKDIISKKGYREVIRRAVYGMLPINKLRDRRMKKLTISE